MFVFGCPFLNPCSSAIQIHDTSYHPFSVTDVGWRLIGHHAVSKWIKRYGNLTPCRSTLWVRVSQYSIGLRTYCFWHQSDVIDQCWPVIVVYGSVLHLILDSTWVWYGLLPELKILTLVWHWDYFLCPRRSWTRCIVKLILSKWWEHSYKLLEKSLS